MPTIKKHQNNNQYALTPSGLWVRDFNSSGLPIDINKFTARLDYQMLMQNDMDIRAMRIPEIGSEYLPTFSKVLIVSDGYKFDQKKHIFQDIPQDVCVIGTNRTLAQWPFDEDGIGLRSMKYYFVNNPYTECMGFLPSHDYRPKCICSSRTNPHFLKKYKGDCYYYVPTGDMAFGRKRKGHKALDDYRNPICGAISFARMCNVRKLALFCCDNVMVESRPAMEELPNGLWMYPQNNIMHEVVDGQFFWLREQDDVEMEIVDHSSGPKYDNATYIELEDLTEFFGGNK